MTHPPSTAQGRWKLRSQPVSQQVMAAPLSPQTKQCWKEHSSPHQRQPQGLPSQPHASGQGAGCGRCWVTPRRCARRTRLLCWSLCGAAGSQASAPELAGRAGISFLGSGLSSRKPLLAQISLFLSGPHLLRCPLDCTSNILGEKSHEAYFLDPLLKKLVGKKLQKRKDEELMRRVWQGLPVGKLEEGAPEELTRQNTWAQSPRFCSLCPQVSGSASARRHSMHAGGERGNASGNEHLCGARGSAPEGLPPRAALSLPSWLMGRAGGLGEEGGMAGTGVPAGAQCPAWAPRAEERRGPAPGLLGSSCLPLPPLSAPR